MTVSVGRQAKYTKKQSFQNQFIDFIDFHIFIDILNVLFNLKV